MASDLPPAAKLYFAVGKSHLPKGALTELRPIITYLQVHGQAKAIVSGFHDPAGNKASNDALAFSRAKAVAAFMAKVGVSPKRVELAKPAETEGTGNRAEARRVEVSVQP